MKSRKKTYRLAVVPTMILLSGLVFCLSACRKSDSQNHKSPLIEDFKIQPKAKDTITQQYYSPFDGNYARTFNDLHPLHTLQAERHGFAPMATHRDTISLKGRIVYLHPGEYENFIIDSLPHSIPIMIPQVARLIGEIGASFRDSLRTIDFPDCKIIVTSITRTESDIKKLRRQNGNAIHESTHRHGTSFDISWIRFHKADSLDTRTPYQRILKRTLAKVLNRAKQEKKCYVKYETQQMCFHITIRQDE